MKSYLNISCSNQELQRRLHQSKGQNAYLRKRLGKYMKEKQRILESPTGSNLDEVSEAESQHFEYEEDVPRRFVHTKRPAFNTNSNDFKVDMPEFEGKIDPEEFFYWLSTVERVFQYKDIPEDKKVKLVALKLRKYASLWWTNLCAKGIRN